MNFSNFLKMGIQLEFIPNSSNFEELHFVDKLVGSTYCLSEIEKNEKGNYVLSFPFHPHLVHRECSYFDLTDDDTDISDLNPQLNITGFNRIRVKVIEDGIIKSIKLPDLIIDRSIKEGNETITTLPSIIDALVNDETSSYENSYFTIKSKYVYDYPLVRTGKLVRDTEYLEDVFDLRIFECTSVDIINVLKEYFGYDFFYRFIYDGELDESECILYQNRLLDSFNDCKDNFIAVRSFLLDLIFNEIDI